MHRVSRGIGPGGRVVYSATERRDGLGTIVKVERGPSKEEIPMRPVAPGPPDELLADLARTGNGKLARLPLALRNKIFQRIADNEPGTVIVSWLNALPEVQDILNRYFQGRKISPKNLSEFEKKYFSTWLSRQPQAPPESTRADRERQAAELTALEEKFNRSVLV